MSQSNPTDGTSPIEISLPRPGWKVRLRRILLSGLGLLISGALTIFILIKTFAFMDRTFAPLVEPAIGTYLPDARIPGVGVVLTLLLVLLLGWLSTNMVGRTVIHGFERLLGRIPVAGSIYSATKGIMEAVSHDKADAFKRVVLIEYPKKDIFALALVTGSTQWPTVHPRMADCVLVFLPTTPNPTSGFLLLVPRDQAIDLPISVEEGIRMVISGGILLPELPPPGVTVVGPTGAAEEAADGATEVPLRQP